MQHLPDSAPPLYTPKSASTNYDVIQGALDIFYLTYTLELLGQCLGDPL